MKKILTLALAGVLTCNGMAQTGDELPFQTWALTPPMGWNSWDCYGPTVVESEVKANADYMAEKLLPYGWEYVVVDIRWFVENDKAGGYNQTDPIYVYDEYGRYTPALNRFPSAAGGVGFRALADYVHAKGLKFGIHLMRGLPKRAVEEKLPVKGTDGITCDMIANNDSACTWLRDNYKVDCTRPGAQEYYNSCFELYAQWQVDFVKIDDLSRPYHHGEIEMIRRAIDHCGRNIVLSMSPGETPLEEVEHAKAHANMWRTVDDFWDNWSQLNYQFQVCARWAPYIAPGTWPDADMLPLGKISIRGERGVERYTSFTRDEQYTMMNLWSIFKSPLMFGGDLPQNDAATDSLLTNRSLLYMHAHSAANRQVSNHEGRIVWSADDPANGDKFVALFNAGGSSYVNTKDALWRSGTVSYLTTGRGVEAEAQIPQGSSELALVVTDGGDSYDCDHADWINPLLTLSDGSTIKLTEKKYLRATCGWGSVQLNKNLQGGSLSVDGQKYSEGYAVHANSILLFEIPQNAVKFTAFAGIDNTGSDQGSRSSVEFMVFNYDPTLREETTDASTGGNVTVKVDPGKQVATSGFIGRAAGRQQATMQAPIAGAEKLYLVVTNGGDDFAYDHADWAEPLLVDSEGNETSLTQIAWDDNPVNGWYAPKLNKNNEGNTLTIGGVAYSRGFGVNAPSVLTFTLPSGHRYVTFKATVGFDDDVKNAPQGATMEFRLFTQNPAPDNTATVPLDLAAIGFAADQPCTVTDMWSGLQQGTFKNSEFAPMLRSHASALYRVSATGRSEGAAVALTVDEGEKVAGRPFDIKIALTGGEVEGAYFQLLCDGKIIGTLVPAADGSATYRCSSVAGGSHTFVARYSGTAVSAPALSGELNLTLEGEAEDLSPLQSRLHSLVAEAEALDTLSAAGATRQPLAEAIAAARQADTESRAALEEAIARLQEALDAARVSMSAVNRLRDAMQQTLDFAGQIAEGDEKASLLAAVEEAQRLCASPTATADELRRAAQELEQLVAQVKRTAEPLPGCSFEVTDLLLANPSFELGTTGWSVAKKTSGWESFGTWGDRPAADGSSFVSLCYENITSIDLYQTVASPSPGIYSLSAALRNTDGMGCVTDQHLYALAGGRLYESQPLARVSGSNNNDWYRFSVDSIAVEQGESLRVGVLSNGKGSGTAGWFQADDFRLSYYGRAGESSIESPVVRGEGLLIAVAGRTLRVEAAKAGRLALYGVEGRLLATLQLRPGLNTHTLSPGLYVVEGYLFAVR